MSSTTIYHCDQCRKKIGKPYGPLIVAIKHSEPGVNECLDLCSFECLRDWVVEAMKK